MKDDLNPSPAVLVIDDEESMREGCRQTLVGEGYRTTVAGDGEEGLRLVEEVGPNVALVDLVMPGMSGMEVIERIHEIDPHVVVIVITGYGTIESTVEAMRARVFDYLAKPFAPEKLLEAVAGGLKRSFFDRRSAALEREKEAALGNFAAIVCHQLRSPAAAAAQCVEVVSTGQVGPLTAKQQSMLERAHRRLEDLTGLIGDWLKLTRVEAGTLQLESRPVELSPLIVDAWSAVPDEEARGRVTLQVQAEHDVPPVLGEEHLLRQLFTSLFSNSVKFTSGPGKVTVSLSTEGGRVVASVSDSGTGIPEEELPHVFEPFYRGARAGVKRTGGHGLGLAIARKIASVHGGTIRASSAPGQGATFTLRLPVKRDEEGSAIEKKADVVVIGGSAGGLTAAITARRHYPDKSILLIRKEKQVLIPCGIPYIFGTVGSPEKNLIPDAVLEKNGIELLIDEVTQADRNLHQLTTAAGQTISYRKLVLATGSVPSMPPIPGREKQNVFVVEKDVRYLQTMVDQLEKSHDVVIVGGGFIGMEFADECRKSRDTNVSVVEMLPHCLMLSFDEDICEAAEAVARDRGIQIFAPEKVQAFAGNGAVEGVTLASGRELKADMAIVGAGCRANTKLAEQMGLKLGPIGGVQVNRYMVTSDPDIFACGDCAAKVSFFDGKPSGLKLASTAAKEARIVGANLFGKRRANEGELGVWSTVVAETAFAGAGLSEAEARRMGYDVVVGQAESVNRHPGGMPGADALKVKLVFEKGTEVLLGGQVAGAKSGGEMINVISACVHERMTADDLATFPVGTHPALTASPIAYQLANAAETAINASKVEKKSMTPTGSLAVAAR